MYGVCRHQDYLGLGSALTNKHHDNDLADIMEIGATTVRFAHYQQSDYLYSRCDSLGLVDLGRDSIRQPSDRRGSRKCQKPVA